MARSASQDPVDRFRFQIEIFEDAQSFSFSNTLTVNDSPGSIRAGFSEATLPKANVGEIKYRENIDSQRYIKKPGLVTFDPIVFRRGSTDNRDLYNWYTLVNNDINALSVANELLASVAIPPVYPAGFRKDLKITSYDRAGNPVKSWLVFNAWPTGYKGGNDFSSAAEEKLIEEITLSYEAFVELPGNGDVKEAEKESKKAAADSSIVAAAGIAIGGGKNGGIFGG